MRLSPRYGAEPVITLDGPPGAVLEPVVRQRRRLATTLAGFTAEQWSHASRCDGWTNRDVVVHLDSTNSFWALSVDAGRRGEPTRFLATFDPVRSPAELVAASHDLSVTEVLDRFTTSTEALVDLLGSLEDRDLSAPAEAPPGHLEIGAVLHHALWDAWVHERDILVPLGIAPDEEPDEVALSLRYAAALSPAFAADENSARRGVLAVRATDPEVSFVVEIDGSAAVHEGVELDADLQLRGAAVELVEALSRRVPLEGDVPPGTTWMLAGLAKVFDVESG